MLKQSRSQIYEIEKDLEKACDQFNCENDMR